MKYMERARMEREKYIESEVQRRLAEEPLSTDSNLQESAKEQE